jgi:signal peptidase
MKLIGTFVTAALTGVLFAVCLAVVAIRLLGMGTYVVTGGSMEPMIQKGSLVIVEPVQPSLIRRGDIITFDHYDQVTTHRVIAIDATQPANLVFTTKGDANEVADPEGIHFPGKVGLYRASLPLVGYFVAYAQAYWRIALMAIAALIFIACAGSVVFAKDKRGASAPKPAPRPAPIARPVLVPVLIPIRPAARRRVAATAGDDLWSSHIGWLRENTARAIQAA